MYKELVCVGALQALVDVLTAVRPTQDLQTVVSQLGPGAGVPNNTSPPMLIKSNARGVPHQAAPLLCFHTTRAHGHGPEKVAIISYCPQARPTRMRWTCTRWRFFCLPRCTCGGTMLRRSSRCWMSGPRPPRPRRLSTTPAPPKAAQITQVGAKENNLQGLIWRPLLYMGAFHTAAEWSLEVSSSKLIQSDPPASTLTYSPC